MHRCLRVNDIFRNILEYVLLILPDEDNHWRGYNNSYATNPSLAALARTCRDFLEPSLDVLWRNQLTLGPLICTLPAHLLRIEIEDSRHMEPDNQCVTHHLWLEPTISSSDWERFDYYAAKITSLGYFMFDFPDQDLVNWAHIYLLHCRRPVPRRCMESLCLYRRRAFILPNLRRLRLTHYDLVSFRLVPILLGPNLQELAIAIYHEEFAEHPKVSSAVYREVFPSLLESLSSLCPSLSDLAIFTLQAPHITTSALSFAYNCSKLVGFTVASVQPSQELLLHLAQQRSLRKTFLSLDEETAELSWLQSVKYPFPSLDTLNMRAPDLKCCAALINAIGACALRIVRFDAYKDPPPAADLRELFAALRTNCAFHTLQTVVIEFPIEMEGKAKTSGVDHALNPEIISLLYPFSRMRFFRIHAPYMCHLSDQDLMDMADHWPLLIELRISDAWEWYTGPDFKTTWAGVAYVAWKCPQLIELALALDMRVDNVAETTSREGFRPNTSLRFINCLDSMMCDVELCARSVHAFGPLVWEMWASGWGEFLDGFRLPPDEDPMGFFEAVNTLLREAHASEEVDVFSLASKHDQLEEMNPWSAPTIKREAIWTRVQ